MLFRLILAGLIGSTAAVARAAVIAVDARTVVFAAAGNGNPDPGGIVPATIPLPVGSGRILQVDLVTGTVSPAGPGFAFEADGGDFLNVTPWVFGYNGIAGVSDTGSRNVMALMGVFTAGVPDPASRPADRNVTAEKDLPAIEAILNQPFFIGDGQWSGGRQQFRVPDGATGFSFGFADAVPQLAIYQGPPGNYSDNEGALSVTYSIVPEPGTPAMFGLLAMLGASCRLRRNRARVK